jgi:hypothetical protein
LRRPDHCGMFAGSEGSMNERFSLGKVLGTGFRVWGTNIVPFLVITSVVYIPLLIWGVTSVSGGVTLESFHKVDTFSRASTGIIALLNIIVSAALTYGVVMELQGQRASIGRCIGTGLSRFFPVLGVGILTVLCVIGGFIALIIPGIIILCMLYVATPASVIERPGLVGALKRSRVLTENHRLEIFGLLLVLGLIGFGVQKLVENTMLPSPEHLDEFLKAIPSYLYVDMARQIVMTSLDAVMCACAYYYLRQEKEGTSAAELAKVFE